MNIISRNPITKVLTYTITRGAPKMPALAMKPQPDGAHKGTMNLDLGDSIFARVDLTTWPLPVPTDDEAQHLSEAMAQHRVGGRLSVVMAEGKAPIGDDDPLLSGLEFSTSADNNEELHRVVTEFLRQRLEQEVSILFPINTAKEQKQ